MIIYCHTDSKNLTKIVTFYLVLRKREIDEVHLKHIRQSKNKKIFNKKKIYNTSEVL